MALKNLSRSFSFSRRKPAHSRRRLNYSAPCAAEVLESRVLLSATVAVTPAAATPGITSGFGYNPPATLFVDPTSTNPAVYHTIQAAVNAASAGDRIKVAPGTYNEDVTVGKSLTILGGQVLAPGESGPSTVEFQSTGFTVSSANKVTIEGFTIEADPASTTSTGNALLATKTANSKFDNNVIVASTIELDGGVTSTEVANNSDPSRSTFSIDVTGNPSSNSNDSFLHNTLNQGGLSLDASATGAYVADNSSTDAGSGSGTGFFSSADNATFIGNTANNTHVGFWQLSGNNASFYGNTADNNGAAFDAMDVGGTLKLVGNVADNNTFGMPLSATTLIVIGNTVDGTTIFDAFNLSATAATIWSNTANNNATNGFIIDAGSLSLVGNIANGNGERGFGIQAGSKAMISGNTADGNGTAGFGASKDGFDIATAPGATILGNTAKNNGASGFDIGSGFDVTSNGSLVTGNTALNNGGDGFTLGASQSIVFGNTADNNRGDGIHLVGATDNTLLFNTANSNGNDGFDVDVNSTDNVFSHNTALGNNPALGNTLFDLSDASTGSGTADTANTWTDNRANTANPSGLL